MRVGREAFALRTLRDWLAPGQSIHILLSGPSLSNLSAPQRLTRCPTIVVNGAHRLLADATQARADLYLVSDVGYIRRQWPSFVAGAQRSRALALDHRVLREVALRDPDLLRRQPVYLFDNLTRPYGRSSRWWAIAATPDLLRRGRECAFSFDPQIGYFPSCTVAYLALQIAATQKPRRIVLFGLDLGGGRFYAETAPERSMLDQDRAQIERDFRFAADAVAARAIEVLNASPDSRLPDSVWPKCDPERYLHDLFTQLPA